MLFVVFFLCSLGCEPLPTPSQPSQRRSLPKRATRTVQPTQEDAPSQDDLKQQQAALQAARRYGKRGRGRKLRPVYYEHNIPANPLAQKLCDALHTLPALRKKQCCKERSLGYLLTHECTRTLSIALHQKSLKFDASRLPTCIKALEQAHQGCAWIGPWPPKTPHVCLGLFQGARSKGQRCRSSLECQKPLHCQGLTPTRPGRCRPPFSKDTPCSVSPDPLAVYTRQDDTEQTHPVCQGYCRRFRCQAKHAPQSACVTDIQCPNGHYCDGKRCIQGAFAPAQGACSGRCAPSFRCFQRRCIKPKATGVSCTSSLECQGACEIEAGQKSGQCAPQCVHPLLRPRRARRPQRLPTSHPHKRHATSRPTSRP